MYEDSDYRYNVIKIDQEGKIINKLYVTDKYITVLIWQDPDLYVIHRKGDIVHVKEESVIKLHHIKNVWGGLYGGAVDNNGEILILDYYGGRVISYNVQTGHQDIKLQGLQLPHSVTKTVYNNQVLYLLVEYGSHRVNLYNSTWIKQTTLGSG